jgi:putative membrane protein
MNLIVRLFLLVAFIVGFYIFGLEQQPPLLTIKNEDYFTFVKFIVILMLLNAFVKPILKLITLPLSCITLGGFALVINVVIVLMADYYSPNLEFTSYKSAFIFSVTFSIFSALVHYFQKD